MNNTITDKRGYLKLSRLETLTDVVYGIVLWRIFVLIPKPGDTGFNGTSISSYVSDNLATFVLVIVAVAITIIYWLQNNVLFGNLEKTDGRHTALSILQLFTLLIFLTAIKVGIFLEASPPNRAFESGAAALMGLFAGLGFSYAVKNRRLLLPEVSDADARKLSIRIMAEPITAVFTLLFVFTPILWELSWLSYPVAVKILSRQKT